MDPIMLTIIATFGGGVIRAGLGWLYSWSAGDSFDLLDFTKSVLASGAAAVGTGVAETNPWLALLAGAGAGSIVSKFWKRKVK